MDVMHTKMQVGPMFRVLWMPLVVLIMSVRSQPMCSLRSRSQLALTIRFHSGVKANSDLTNFAVSCDGGDRSKRNNMWLMKHRTVCLSGDNVLLQNPEQPRHANVN